MPKSRSNLFSMFIFRSASAILAVGLVMFVCAPGLYGQSAQLFHWSNCNLQGMGYVTGMVIQPRAPYDIYVRTDVGGVYRFDRAGDRWLPLLDGIDEAQTSDIGAESVAIDPTHADRVYCAIPWHTGTSGTDYKNSAEVLVSEDRGKSWRPTGLGANHAYIGNNDDYRIETGERLAVDPDHSDTVYFATRENGLWKGIRSLGDYAWSQVRGGLPDPASLPYYHTYHFDAATKIWKQTDTIRVGQPGFTFVVFGATAKANSAARPIYVGVHGRGVYASSDSGATWTLLKGGPDSPCRGVVARDGSLFVSCSDSGDGGRPAYGGVWRCRDGGWTDITPADKNPGYTGIAVDPADPSFIMVGRDGKVYHSHDAGAHWAEQTLALKASDNAGAPGYYTSDWAGVSGGVAAISFDPQNSSRVWWTNGWGVARCDDISQSQPHWIWHMMGLEELVSSVTRVPPKPKAEGGADGICAVGDVLGFRIADRDVVPSGKINPAGVPLPTALTSNAADRQATNQQWKNLNGGIEGGVFPSPWPQISALTGLDYCYSSPDYLATVGFHEYEGAAPIYASSRDNGRTWQAFETVPTETFTDTTAKASAGAIAVGAAIPAGKDAPALVWSPAAGHLGNPWWFASQSTDGTMVPWPHYSSDGGKTWLLCKLKDSDQKPPFALNNDGNNAAWAAHADCLPKGWGPTITPWISSGAVASDRADRTGKTFYYYCDSGTPDGSRWGLFYVSLDGGATWSLGDNGKFPPWTPSAWIESNPLKQGDVWICLPTYGERVTGNKLYHSTDFGNSFSAVESVAGCEGMTFGRGTAAMPAIYVFGKIGSAAKNAFYKSMDMGANWIRISEFGMTGVKQIEGDMRTPNLLYVTRSGRGVMYGEASAK